MLSVLDVVGAGLCAGCGGCVVFCPHGVLRMVIDEVSGVFVPTLVVDGECVGCGFCLKVCPGHEVDFDGLNRDVFGFVPDDPYLGNFSDCFVGFSCDDDLRFGASSGGLVSQFLVFALNEGLIDGALVTRMSKDDPLMPEPFIAYTDDDILDAKGSKYCPVPVNLALKEIIDAPDDFKFAVVGLPCHIHGIRKAEQVNKKLKNKIKIHLGIMCGTTKSFPSMEYQLKKMDIKKNDVKKIEYRGSGWPGNLTIEKNNGEKIKEDYLKYYSSNFSAFFPWRCTLCIDHSCELADVSFADAWLKEIKSIDTKGSSVIVSRKKPAKLILDEMKNKNLIELYDISSDDVARSQNFYSFKKRKIRARLKLVSLMRSEKPSYTLKNYNELPKPIFTDYLMSVWLYFWRFIANHKKLWPVFNLKRILVKFHNLLS